MTTRLLVLVLVPLVGLAAISAGTVRSHARSAESAAEVHSAVDRVGRLVALRAALFHERSMSLSAATIRERGVIDLATANRFAGFDIAERQRTHAAEADRALAALGQDAGVVRADQLADMRAAAAADPPSKNAVNAAFAPIEARIDAAQARILTDVQGHLDTVGAATVADGLGAVRLQMDAVSELSNLLDSFTQLFLAEGEATAITRRLATSRSAITRAVRASGRTSHPVIANVVVTFEDDPGVKAYRTSMQVMENGQYPKSADGPDAWKEVADLSANAMRHNVMLFEVIDDSITAVARTAADLEAAAQQELRWWSFLVYSLVIVSVGISVVLARSISRPLGRLRDHAAALSAGEVDLDPLSERGPRDVAVTSRAFNDLMANLRLLEAKTRALADLDLGSEALAAPLPGRLGQALQGSIAAVSGSITERDELRRHIVHQASHDELTGLLNRSAIVDSLGQSLARARRKDAGVAVLLVDIDQFKRLNDTHSQTFGDHILLGVANRLRRTVDSAAVVGRVGADQFAIVIEDVADPEPVAKLARSVAEFDRPLRVESVSVTLTVSVGVSFSWDADDAGQMLARADLALTRAKSRAAGSVEIFDAALQEQLSAQAAIEDALARALGHDDELFLQYQPVIELATGATTSVEALIRWNRPNLGIQPPDSFIPVAERSNLIVDLDRWVMARAARQAETWRDNGLGAIDVAVNISGRHLSSETLYDHVHSLLQTTSTDPRRLIIEITETALVDDLVVAAAQLEAIRHLGVRIALDDFGTGYTSIAHLQRLPVDVIKIDRSFIAKLGNTKDRALLRMITELGHELGNTITAEGVETREQYELLRALGCDRAQGFLMSRPLIPADLEAWMNRRAPTH